MKFTLPLLAFLVPSAMAQISGDGRCKNCEPIHFEQSQLDTDSFDLVASAVRCHNWNEETRNGQYNSGQKLTNQWFESKTAIHTFQCR